MSGKDLANAAEAIKRKKALLRNPVPMMPDDPENIRLSKAEFLAKRRKFKEEEAAVEKFRQELRSKKKEKEVEDAVQEREEEEREEVVEEKPRRKKRPKRIE